MKKGVHLEFTAANKTSGAMSQISRDLGKVQNAMKGTSHHAVNMGNQFADIAIMSQMGMRPGMIALQQGSQLISVYEHMKAAGGGAAGAVKALGSAFMMMINPVNLAIFALVYGASVLIQWAMGSEDAAEKTKTFSEALTDVKTVLDTLRSANEAAGQSVFKMTEEYGSLTTQVQAANAVLLQAAQQDAFAQQALAIKTSTDAFAELFVEYHKLAEANQLLQLPQTDYQIRALAASVNMTSAELATFTDLIYRIDTADTFQQQAQGAANLLNFLTRTYGTLDKMPPQIREMAVQMAETVKTATNLHIELGKAPGILQRIIGLGPAVVGVFNRAASAAQGIANKLGLALARYTALAAKQAAAVEAANAVPGMNIPSAAEGRINTSESAGQMQAWRDYYKSLEDTGGGSGGGGSGGGQSLTEDMKSDVSGLLDVIKEASEKVKATFNDMRDTISSSMMSSFKALVKGTKSLGEAARDILGSIIDKVIELLMTPIFNNIASGLAGGLLKGLGGLGASFEGGGSTGNGPRVGGVDGRGGMVAVVHPNETIIDHTKGGKAGGTVVNINVYAKDADSFRASKRQIVNEMRAALS